MWSKWLFLLLVVTSYSNSLLILKDSVQKVPELFLWNLKTDIEAAKYQGPNCHFEKGWPQISVQVFQMSEQYGSGIFLADIPVSP